MNQWLRRGLPALMIVIIGWGLVVGGNTGDRALDLGNRIGCPKCDGESAAESQVPTAETIMSLIREQVDNGWSDKQVLEFFTARYGPSILLDPPLDLGGIILWAVPVAGLLGGAVLLSRRDSPKTSEGNNEVVEAANPASLKTVLGIIGGALAVTAAAFALGQVLEPAAQTSVVAGDIDADLENISNEVLETTIAAFKEAGTVAPQQLNAMELALAERYFEEENYLGASDHFQAVLGNQPLPIQASEAYGRLGWILYVNGESETAEVAYQQALSAFSTNTEAAYFYGILLVNTDRGPEAVPYLQQVAASPSAPADVLENVQTLLNEVGGS